MANVQLRAVGLFQAAQSAPVGAVSCVRPALIVYAGKFQSMDGEVEVTAEKLARLVEAHNARMAACMQQDGKYPLKNCPPVQLDHSTSAHDTVGRVVGPLQMGLHRLEDGSEVPGVFGELHILGRENVEKVEDGRWTNLSFGGDFEIGLFSEATITPFPAAPNASMLRAGLKDTKLSAEGPAMDRSKLKKYLTDHKKMSENDADMHLSKLSDESDELKQLWGEHCEHERMSAEAADKETKEKEEKEKADRMSRMSAARDSITRMATSFGGHVAAARLAAKKGQILTRLSKLRAAGKITPAEIKKTNLTELSALDDKAIGAVLKTYEDREPVIHMGQFGSLKATDISKLGAAGQAQRMSDLERETRKNMTLLAKTADDPTRLAATADQKDPAPVVPPPTVSEEDAKYFEKEYGEIVALMDGSKNAEAKDRLKAHFVRMSALGLGAADAVVSSAVEQESEITALVESVGKMQTEFEDLKKLTGTLVDA